MSTLCVYENYLRDRYVLGNPVHYAAGSNSPKPKSYDREGNEYTWSDEAGDYVRQVGGPGGGRTIRLSEVEKAEVEQPQNGQANADSGQNDPKKEATPQSSVDYSEFADAYKRYRAEDKKVASLKRKASKIQKAVSAPSSGATPEEIQSARESLAKIRGEISDSEKVKDSLSPGLNSFTKKHNVVFIDGGDSFVVNPSSELLQGLEQRESLQGRVKRARKKAEEAKKAGLKTNASEVTSIADKLEGELNRVNDLLSQMFPNETVVSAVDEKPKRRPANKKQESQRKISFDKNASYEELVQKHYPDGKQVDSGDLGYTPSWQHRGVITLPDITLAIESNNLTFFDNVLAPTRFDDYDVVVLQDPDGNKRRLTSFELFELIRERLEDNNPEEPYRQEENDVDDALYGYKWVKLPRELRRAVDKRDKTRQINRVVSEAIVVLNDFQEQIGNIAKYDEIPGDLLTGLVDCYLGIEKTAPHHDEDVGPKKIFLSRVNNFLAGVSLARFLADNEDSPARGAAVRLVEDFLEAALSKTPKRKFNAIYDKAKELGFSLYSAVDVYNSFYTPAEYSAVKPTAPGESQGYSNIKPDRTDEDTKEPKESGTQFDASGLGLPGKSDAALKPDVAENKDAAYFIRRDLEATPKPEIEEGVEEVDEVSEAPSSEAPQRDDAALERKVKEALGKGEPLRKKATRLRTKAKEAALKGRKEEAAGLRKQADEIETEARKYIDEATSAGVELKNRRAQALPSSEERPAEETQATVSTEQLSPDEKTEEIPYWRSYMLRFEKEARTVPEGMAYSVIGSLWTGGMALNVRGDFEFATRARDALIDLSKRLTGDDASTARRRANTLSESIERAKRYHEKYGQPLLSPTQNPQSATKKPAENSVPTQPVVSEQQANPVSEPVQKQPAKPRPERWTPLKSKMNDDDKRVVENTRKRLSFGLGDFAWRIANAKEKKDWQKVKELTALAAQRYLEQARRAYRSHGGADALAAFDETLSGEGLTVGQVRDRVVDKFRQLALMNVADLHKYAGERLDEWETFSQGSELSSSKDKIALNHLLDKFHYDPNAVPYTPPEKGKVYEVPVDSLNLDPNRFQFKLNTNAQGVTDDLEGAEFDPMQAGIIHVWRDPDDGKDYVVNGHHRFNLAKNSGYDGKVNVRYIDADTADDAKAFGAVANIADSKGTATDVAEFIRTRGSDDIRTPAGKKIATKNKLLADGRILSKLDDTIFRKLKNGSIDEKTARIIAAELPDDKEKQLRLFSDIERLGLDASQAQDRAWAYASIQGEKQQGSLFGDDAPMEYDVESRSKLIGEIRKALGGAKRAAQAGGSSRNNEYWESQKLAANFDRDRAKQLSKTAGQTLDFFKDHIRLTGPMQNIIKEETDEYRKAIKAGKGAEKVVERAIERIKDVAQGGDGSVRRVEGLGLEYEDRLPSSKSEQTGQGVEANGRGEKQKPSRTPSESLRNGTAGEVLETGGADRLSDGGDGRNLASVIAEEAKKSDIPKSRVREELDAARQPETSTPHKEEKPDWLVALESQEDLKPVSRGKYNPNAKPYSWKAEFPESEDELREYWREHVDGGEDEEVSFGSDGERVSVGEQRGDAPMTSDELRRFAQLRHGRELRKSLGLSEHFSEKELKELQEPSEKRGRGRPSKKTAGAEPLDKDVVQDRIAEAVAGRETSKRKRNLQHSTKPQGDSLLGNKRENNISDEEARRRIAKDNRDSFISAFNSIPKKAPSYWLARKIVNEINDRLSFGGWFAKASIREMLKKLNEDLRMQVYYSVGPSRLDSSAKDLAARLGIERGASHDYFNDLITDLDRAWLQTNPENIGLPSITSYRNGTYISPISPKKKVKRTSNRSSKTFDPDSIKDDVKKAVSIRDADRSQLSGESMESMMSIAKNVYNKHGKDGLKEFMRSIGVVPTAGTRSKLLEELKGELGEVSANRSKGTLIRKMGAEKA